MKAMNVCVLLPAYNEEKNIVSLLEEIKKLAVDIIVVDDGCADNTAELARSSGVTVLSHPKNLGKGLALRTGFEYLKNNGYDAVVVMDSDGQHLPAEINKFIQYARNSLSGIIVGNRMHKPEGMPLARWLTNKFTSFCISRLVGYKIPDSQCGFRLIRAEVLRKINLSTVNYDTESEILLEAAKNNFKIESIPIKTLYNSHKSQIHPVADTIRFFNLVIKSVFSGK